MYQSFAFKHGPTKHCTELILESNPIDSQQLPQQKQQLPKQKINMSKRTSLQPQQLSNARRRVIFPVLHQPASKSNISKEETPSHKNDPKSACHKRAPSLDSINNLAAASYPLVHLSPSTDKGANERDESSPKCVSFSYQASISSQPSKPYDPLPGSHQKSGSHQKYQHDCHIDATCHQAAVPQNLAGKPYQPIPSRR